MKLNLDTIAFGTDVQTIEVPAKLLERYSTGVEWFDNALGGEGLTPSQVMMFTGEAGAGKTTALLSVASGLATNENNIVVYNSAEESKYQIKRTVNRLGLQGRFLLGGETNVDDLIEKCDRLRAKHPDRQFFLILDSLQCIEDGKFSTGRITSATADRVMERLTTWCKEYFINVIAVGQVTKGGTFAGSNKLRHMIDTMVHLSWEKRDKEMMGFRQFEISKNRFGGAGCLQWMDMQDDGLMVVGETNT